MKKSILNLLPAIALVSVLISCEKVIDVEVPETASTIVIEGSIEAGSFPLILITRSESYFAPISTSAEALSNVMVDSARVFIKLDGVETEIEKFCFDDLPSQMQELTEDLLGFDSIPAGLDICAWVNPLMSGVEGKPTVCEWFAKGKSTRQQRPFRTNWNWIACGLSSSHRMRAKGLFGVQWMTQIPLEILIECLRSVLG